MTVLGFLIVILIFSLGKMYFSSDSEEWKRSKKSHPTNRDQTFIDADEGWGTKKQEWLSYRK